ncbi:MAG: hypothetical protein JJT85_13105 [Chromatiales bacterium]|nr:hypothetical protein [Chromatiales bacterium]
MQSKTDFEFNLAISGARCPDLVRGAARQVDPLLGLLKRNAAQWDRGVVVIRIGVNSIATPQQLQRYRVEGLDQGALHDIRECSSAIRAAMEALRAVHPSVRILLVGLFDESDAPPLIQEVIPPEELKRLRTVLDQFDDEIGRLAEEDPLAVFLEDRTWWRERWGSHDPETGIPQPRSLSLGGPTRISNTRGDHPRNAVLEDGHAGTAVNGIWAQNLVNALRREFGFDLTPISLDEIAELVDPDGSHGIR